MTTAFLSPVTVYELCSFLQASRNILVSQAASATVLDRYVCRRQVFVTEILHQDRGLYFYDLRRAALPKIRDKS